MEHITVDVEFSCLETGALLRGRFIRPTNGATKIPIVFMLTGDGPKGTKSLSWTNIPPKLAEFEIGSFLFDFEGLGYSDGERRNLTLSKGIANFRSAHQRLLAETWIDTKRIGIFGSSFGANAALLCPEILNSCAALGFKSPCCFLPDAYANEIGLNGLEEWFRSGFSEVNNYELKVLTDCFRYNAYETARQINTPCLITHGTNDEVVPIYQSIFLHNLLNGEKRLDKFVGGDHGYSEDGAWDRMARKFVSWFSERLTSR